MEINNEKIKTMDKNILLSIIDMKLRDFYKSLDELLDDLNINKEILNSRLSELNYFYNEKFNQYIWSDLF